MKIELINYALGVLAMVPMMTTIPPMVCRQLRNYRDSRGVLG